MNKKNGAKKGFIEMGKDTKNLLRRFLATSGDKMLTLFEELKGSDASPELVQVHFFCLFVCFFF